MSGISFQQLLASGQRIVVELNKDSYEIGEVIPMLIQFFNEGAIVEPKKTKAIVVSPTGDEKDYTFYLMKIHPGTYKLEVRAGESPGFRLIKVIGVVAKRQVTVAGFFRVLKSNSSSSKLTNVAEFKSKEDYELWLRTLGDKVRIINHSTTSREEATFRELVSLNTGLKTYTITYEEA